MGSHLGWQSLRGLARTILKPFPLSMTGQRLLLPGLGGRLLVLSGVIPAPHLTSSQASTWVKTPQVGHVPLTI